MPETIIRRLYIILTLFFGGAGFAMLALHGVRLAGWQPLPISQLGTLMGASFGAAALGLAALCAGVVRSPARAEQIGGPIAVVLFAMALVRYLTFFYGEEPLVTSLGAALVAEVIVLSGLGMVTGTWGVGLPGIRAIGRMLFRDVSSLRPALKIWLGLLVLAGLVLPLPFVTERPAQMILLAQVLNMAGAPLYRHMGGLVRGLSLAHLVAWPLAVVEIVIAARQVALSTAYGAWLWLAAVVLGMSLLIDAVDFVRWLAGDREPLSAAGRRATRGC